MIDRLFLTALSLTLGGYAWQTEGPVLSDLMLLAIVAGFASLIVLLLPRRSGRRQQRERRDGRSWVVVDGSNIIHWGNGTPQVETLAQVLAKLTGQGFSPYVIFDANVGYKLADRYMGDAELAGLLHMPIHQVRVVNKGTPADQIILKTARNRKARVVTNDRYRDWAEAHPEVLQDDLLIRGGFRGGSLWIGQMHDAPEHASRLAAAV